MAARHSVLSDHERVYSMEDSRSITVYNANLGQADDLGRQIVSAISRTNYDPTSVTRVKFDRHSHQPRCQ